MIKWIGKHIVSLAARFRSTVHIESLAQEELTSPVTNFTHMSTDNNVENETGAIVFAGSGGKLFKSSYNAVFGGGGMQIKPPITNSDLTISSNGTGSLILKSMGGIVTEGGGLYDVGEIRLKEAFGGPDYVGFKPPADLASSCIWTLPAADGAAGQTLSTNGTKTLSWADTADKNYVHTQSVSSTSWVVTHNLNKNPSVSVTDSAGTAVIGKVDYNSLNQVTLTFKSTFSGKAYFN
tara:strand:+ start:960 stop:1667 length:708 start_codon:yes stop_codon:yes gene_type:complete